MTDWKEAARKHEASADGYARLNYRLLRLIEKCAPLVRQAAESNPDQMIEQPAVNRIQCSTRAAILAEYVEQALAKGQ